VAGRFLCCPADIPGLWRLLPLRDGMDCRPDRATVLRLCGPADCADLPLGSAPDVPQAMERVVMTGDLERAEARCPGILVSVQAWIEGLLACPGCASPSRDAHWLGCPRANQLPTEASP